MSTQVESMEDVIRSAGENSATVLKYISEIELYDEAYKEYYDLCTSIKEAYRDDKKKGKKGRYNVLWSNLENLKPSVLYNSPKVEVGRRYKDKDPLARDASTILERATQYCTEAYPFMRQAYSARDEFLLYGRGVMWNRYLPHFEQFETQIPVIQIGPESFVTEQGDPVDPMQVEQDPNTAEFYIEDVTEDLGKEEVKAEFVHGKNFGHNVCRTQDEIKIAWRIVYMNKDELSERFPDIADDIPLNYLPKNMDNKSEVEKSFYKKSEIYEIWDKTTKQAVWINKDYKKAPLDVIDDPLKLADFFPFEIVYGSTEPDSLIPMPDYSMYRAIGDELAEVNRRISALTKAIKVTGAYPALYAETMTKIQGASPELSLHAVENWVQHVNSGGFKGMIDWLPIQEIAVVLRYLYEVKDRLKQDLYEISGQSDILRGQTDPRETATAQNGKMKYATLRLDAKQKAFAEFLRNILQKKAEIIAEHFEDMSIYQMAAVDSLGPELQQSFSQAVQLLRDDAARNYRIDIETDSTIAQDDQQAQGKAVEFFNAMTQGFNDALPIIQGIPEAAEVLTEGLAMVARTFKAGRSLDAAIERMGEALRMKAQQPPPPPQGQEQPQEAPPVPPQMDPRVLAEQIRARSRQEQLMQEGQYKQADLSLRAQKMQTDAQIAAMKLQQEKERDKARFLLDGVTQGHNMGNIG